jgi:TldD protein
MLQTMNMAHNQQQALELAYIAVEECLRLGASYADARFESREHEEVRTRNGRLTQVRLTTGRGIGLRALVKGTWAFIALSEPTRHDVAVAARGVVEMARASAIVSDVRHEVPPMDPERGAYRTRVEVDPFDVPVSDKVERLLRFDDRILRSPQIVMSRSMWFGHRVHRSLVTSEGSEIEQQLTCCHLGFEAGASDGSQLQVASCPPGRHGVEGRGWEAVAARDPEAEAERLGGLALEQLQSEPCPPDTRSVILAPDVVGALLLASSPLFHAAGPHQTRIGDAWSSHDVTLTADPELEGAPGGIGFDDEGVPVRTFPLVLEGKVSALLVDRAGAHREGVEWSSGSMRAGSWAAQPRLRPTNLVLSGGTGSDLDGLMAEADTGLVVEGIKSISMQRDSTEFVAVAERAWAVEDGKQGSMYKNPAFRGDVRALWQRLSGLGTDAAAMGVLHWPKARAEQLLASGVLAPHALFREVEVGSSELPAGDSVDLPMVERRGEAPAVEEAGED